MPDCEGELSNGMRFSYYGASEIDGTALEIVDLGSQNEFAEVFDLVRQAHEQWDGNDPVRTFG